MIRVETSRVAKITSCGSCELLSKFSLAPMIKGPGLFSMRLVCLKYGQIIGVFQARARYLMVWDCSRMMTWDPGTFLYEDLWEVVDALASAVQRSGQLQGDCGVLKRRYWRETFEMHTSSAVEAPATKIADCKRVFEQDVWCVMPVDFQPVKLACIEHGDTETFFELSFRDDECSMGTDTDDMRLSREPARTILQTLYENNTLHSHCTVMEETLPILMFIRI